MHTDEYEISIGREIAVCRKMVRKLEKSLERQGKQGDTAAAVALEEELAYWQKTLAEYEAVLEGLRG